MKGFKDAPPLYVDSRDGGGERSDAPGGGLTGSHGDPGPEGSHPAMSGIELYRAYAQDMVNFFARIRIPTSNIDDLVQELFLPLMTGEGYVPGSMSPSVWLKKKAWWLALDYWRECRRRRDLQEQVGVFQESKTSGVDDRAEALRNFRILARALDELDEEHRVVLVLYELDGESTETISSIVGIPKGTVHSRLHFARKRLQEACAELRATERA